MSKITVQFNSEDEIHSEVLEMLKSFAIRSPGTRIEISEEKKPIRDQVFDFVNNGHVAQLSTAIIGDKFAVMVKSPSHQKPLYVCAITIGPTGYIRVSTPKEKTLSNNEPLELTSSFFRGYTVPISG